MRVVVIESPYSGNVERNKRYGRLCVQDSIERGEAPTASHLLITQVLDDEEHMDRERGLAIGHAFIPRVDLLAVYDDFGISEGMQKGINEAARFGVRVEYRKIPEDELVKLMTMNFTEAGIIVSPASCMSNPALAYRDELQSQKNLPRYSLTSEAFRRLLTWLQKHCLPGDNR